MWFFLDVVDEIRNHDRCCLHLVCVLEDVYMVWNLLFFLATRVCIILLWDFCRVRLGWIEHALAQDVCHAQSLGITHVLTDIFGLLIHLDRILCLQKLLVFYLLFDLILNISQICIGIHVIMTDIRWPLRLSLQTSVPMTLTLVLTTLCLLPLESFGVRAWRLHSRHVV